MKKVSTDVFLLEKKVSRMKRTAEAVGFESMVEWANRALYMLNEYGGSKHERQVIEDVRSSISRFEEALGVEM